MRALRFAKTGSLDELNVRDVPIPTPAPGEVLVQVKAAAINPSDVKNVLGKMHETTVPRTPGRVLLGWSWATGASGPVKRSSAQAAISALDATAATRNIWPCRPTQCCRCRGT